MNTRKLTRSSAFKGSLFLLDNYSGAKQAYSLRKLSSAYTGDCIRVRRSSDDTEQNIGFVDNVIDTATLESFCSGTNGFVTTWYDQSSNGLDLGQSSLANQPQIVSSGSLITDGGLPAIQNTDTTGLKTLVNVDYSSISTLSGFSVHKTASTTTQILFENSENYQTVNGAFVFFINSNKYFAGQYSTTTPITSSHSPQGSNKELANFYLKTLQTNATFSTVYADNSLLPVSAVSSGTSIAFPSAQTFNAYARSGSSLGLIGIYQELVIYPTDQSANQSEINININEFYSIY